MGNYEFLNRFAVSSTCGAIPILAKNVLSSYQLWVLRRLWYAFFHDFDEKTCTEAVSVLTICNVWVIYPLLFMQLYRSPTWQTHWKILYNALSRKIIQAKIGQNSFYWKKSHYISCDLCQGLPTINCSVTFSFFMPIVHTHLIQQTKKKNSR